MFTFAAQTEKMQVKPLIHSLVRWPLLPLRRQSTFIATMYALGALSAVLTLPTHRGAHLYDHLWLELWLDVYVVALLLTLLPRWLSVVLRGVAYGVAYSVTAVDVYCFHQFGSTLTPSMLMLVGETDEREAGEFLRSYLSAEMLTSPVGWVLLLAVLHLLWSTRHWWVQLLPSSPLQAVFVPVWQRVRCLCERASAWRTACYTTTALAVVVSLAVAVTQSWNNKQGVARLLSAPTIGHVEHLLTYNDHGEMYLPLYRLVFSLYSNHLAEQQLDRCLVSAQQVTVDSCEAKTPTIVLIVGESFGRHHSHQYGYFMPTTPRQERRQHTQLLTPFTDVVSCWNLTSFVFKNVFSLHTVEQRGEWCDAPLFPLLFRKAGYEVTFLTNQFLYKQQEAVFDFSGGFFLNHPELSQQLFDHRNTQLHRYDEGLLADYDSIRALQLAQGKGKTTQPQLYLFHLMGQHVSYRSRYPETQRHFRAEDYENERPDLNLRQRDLLAHYDNAVRYNDSIVDAICRRFDQQEAVIIYMPDHGEECYEPGRGFICRNHSAAVDYPLAHYEFEIPFWVYCTHRYAVRNPHVFQAIKQARHRPFMTDALPHMLLGLAGIHTPYYQPQLDLLSPHYNAERPRILKNKANYDLLRQHYWQTHPKEANRYLPLLPSK